MLLDWLFGQRKPTVTTTVDDKAGMNPEDLQQREEVTIPGEDKLIEQSESSNEGGFNLGSIMNFLPLLLILPMIMNMFGGD
jgi:hypothetical protein